MDLFDCPACGAALSPDHDQDGYVKCPFCGHQVIVPDHLRRQEVPDGVTVIQVEGSGVQVEIHRSENEALGVGESGAQSFPVRTRIHPIWVTCLILVIFAAIIIPVFAAIAVPLAGQAAFALIVDDLVSSLDSSPVEGATQNQVLELPQKTIDASFAQAILAFGQEGTGAGRFDDTRWVAVDGDGNIYTAEYQDGRIQKFDPQGKFVLGWNTGSERVVTDLAVSRQGIVYVVLGGNIYRYDGKDGREIGMMTDPVGGSIDTVDLGADGGMVLVADGEKILRFDANGQVIQEVKDAISSVSGDAELAARAVLDGLGKIYILGRFNQAVFVYSGEGHYANRMSSGGEEPGQLRAPNDVAVDGRGRVYVSDIFGVEVFANDGRYLGRIGVDGVAFGLAFDDQGNLYIASNADKIIKYKIPE